MEEKERKEKLKAGKEKLAQFQKKKKKKKQKPDSSSDPQPTRTSELNVGGQVLGISTQSGAEFIYDSDNQTTSSCSEDDSEANEEPTSKQFVKLRSELQQKHDRVEELEELLVGKQLALDKVLKENAELQSSTKQSSTECLVNKVKEDGDHQKDLDEDGREENVPQSPRIDPAEVQDLIQQVQWLQLQLKQAGSTLHTQNERQTLTVNALQKAKSEILELQENITQKDNVLTELAKKLKTVSHDYTQLRENQEGESDAGKNKEKGLQDEIQSLQQDKMTVEETVKILEDKLTTALKENEDLETINTTIESERDTRQKSHESFMSDSEKRMYDLQEKNSTLQEENRTLQEKISTLQEKNSTLHKDKEILTDTEAKLQAEINALNEKVGRFETQKIGTDEHVRNLLSENERLLDSNKSLSSEVVNLKEDNTMYQSQMGDYEDKISQAEELLEDNRSLRIQNDDLNNKINNQKDVIAALKGSISTLTSENVKLMEQFENVSSSYSLQTAEIEGVKSERDDLLLLCEERKKALEDLQAQTEHYKALSMSLEDEVASLKLKLSSAELASEIMLKKKGDFQQDLTKQLTIFDKEEPVIISEVFVPQVEEVIQAQSAYMHKAEPNTGDCVHETLECDTVDLLNSLPGVPNTELVYPNGANVHKYSESDSNLTTSTNAEPNNSNKDSDLESQNEKYDNDTAYHSQTTNPGSESNDEQDEQVSDDLSGKMDSLQQKTEECELLKTEIQNLQKLIQKLTDVKPISLDLLSDSNTKDTVKEEARTPLCGREVSPVNFSRIGASEMEVNVHASSYPTTQRDGPSQPSSVQTLEFDHVTFQHRDGAHLDLTNQDQNGTSGNNELDNSGGDASRIQKESAYLNEIVKQLQLEKTELLELYEQEKSDKQAITEELDKVNKTFCEMKEEHEEKSNTESKLQSDLTELQSLSETMKSKNDELSAENEKLTWERDELEIRLNSLDSEFLTMKSVKCDLEYKEEQVREELIQVKERLEYLESCDKDIFEMKEMVEKLQEEKDAMVKENEVLQCSLAAKTDENDRVCKHMDVITKENGNMKSRNQELEQEVLQLNSDIRSLKHDVENNQKEYGKIMEEKDSQEERFIGEIEGLEHENSTLKTKVKSYETELELQKSEMQRLGSFFSNVDSQIEEIGILKHRNSEIETKFEEISKENEDLVNELLNCHKKMEALQYEKEELCSKCDELQNIIDDMDDEKTSLLEINENLICELDLKVKNKDCIIEKYEMQLDGLDNENATLKTQVSSLKQDLQEVLEQSQTLDEDHIQQSEEISVLKSEKEKLKEDAKCTQTKVTQLEEDLLELVNQVQLYDNTLSEKMDLATRLDQQVKGLLNENEELREKCGSLEHDLVEMKTQESYLTDQLKIYEENISNNQNKTDELSRVQQQLELETKYKEKAQGDCETMHTECYKLSKENSQLQTELNSVKKDYDKLLVSRNQDSELINEMKAKIKSAESERDEILLEHQSVSNNVTEVADENEALKTEIEKLNVNLGAISENRNHIRNQVEVLSAEIESLATERDSLAQENGRLLDEIDAVRSSESNLKDSFVKLSDKYQTVIKHSEELDHQNKKLQDQNDEIRLQTIDFQDKLSKLEEAMDDNSNAQGVIESLDKKLADLKCCVDNLRDEKRHLESVIEDLTSMLHDMQTKYEEVKSEMESTKKKCDKEISQLQSHLQVMNDDVTELRKVLDVMENEMYNVNEEKQTLKENFEQQQAELVQAVEAKENLLKKLSDKQQKDLKNMKMVDKLNQEKQDMSQLCKTPSGDDMNSLVNNDTVNVETNSLCNETGVNESELNICEDQIVPSFERIFEFFPLSDQSSVSCHVQTNISIGEFERIGTLLDDNGECVEIAKDSFSNVYTQTEPNDLDEEHSSEEVEHEQLHSDLSCRHSLETNTSTNNTIDVNDYRSHQVTQTDITDLNENTNCAVNSIACQCDTITPMDNVDLQEMYVGESNANSVLNSDNVVLNDTRDTISVTSEDSGLYQTHSNHQTENNVQKNDLVRTEIACQTDIDFKEQFSDEIQLGLKEKCSDLDFREKKVQGLEDNYERKINQMEYELEEKYEHKFRDKVAEIAVQAEKDKKKHASEIETEAKRQIERVKVEKDQQFVVALQQARADLSSKKKGRRSSGRRAVSQGSPKDMEAPDENADVTTEQANSQDVNQLRQDNEELAQARDDLLQKINITQLEQDVFRDQLYSIMGEHQMLGDQQHPQQSPNQQAALMTPSLLDWELSPELSFDSVRSSLDTKSLSGSLDPSSFCSNSDCLSVRMKYEHLIERIQQFLKIKTQDQLATSVKESQSFELEAGGSLNESNSGNKDKFIEHSEPDDQVLQRVTSIHLEHWAKSKNQQDEDGSDVKDTFVEESGQQGDVVMDNIIQEIITESQACPVTSTEFPKTPVYHRQPSRKKSRKRFALTFQSTPSDTDRSPEGINDANVSPFSHCTSSVSTMEEGHFSEDEQDGLSFTTTVKKRHYSDGDIQFNDEIEAIKTSQSDNFEGHFVIEKTSVPQKSRAVSLPPQSQEKSEMENLNDNVFTNTDVVTEKKRTKDSKRKKVNIDGENVFVAEESRDIKVPSIALTKLLKTDSMSGKDSGDFFEESLTSADETERIDSGDILEKIGNEIVIDETGDNSKANSDTFDGVFQEESSPKPEADFIKETEIQCEQSFSVEASVNDKPSNEVRTSEFDNARFDVLNAICPGTDPSRNPEFRNDKERREDEGDKISGEKSSAIDLQEKVNELEGVITILESQKTEAKEKIESLDQKLREITSPDNQNMHIQELEQELRALRRKQAEFDQSVEGPNKDMLLEENRKLTELMKESERLAGERTKELLCVKEEIGLLKKKNIALEELKKDQIRLKEEINQLSLFKENLVQELDQEKAAKINIEKEKTEIEDTLIKQADVYDNLNEKHVLLQQELQRISETKDAEIQKLQDASLEQFDNLNEKHVLLQQELQRISESKDAEIKKLQDASLELQSLSETKDAEIQKLQDASLDLSSKLQKRSSETLTVQKSFESAQEEIGNLKEEREKLKVAIQNNQILIDEQEKNVIEVTKNSDELKQTIKDLQESAETADQQLNDKELKLRESMSEKESLLSKLETLQQELNGLRDKINKQQEVIDEHEKLSNSLQTNKEKQETELQDEIRELKKQLHTDNQIKLEHEWAIKEFASQIEILEKEKQTYTDTIKQLETNMRSQIEIVEMEKQTYCDTIKQLETKLGDVNSTVEVQDREIQALRSEYDAVKERMDTSDTKSDCSNTDQQILEDLKETLKLLQDEKVSMEKQYKEDKAILMDENYTLSEDLKKLQEENAALEKSLKTQEDTLKKENSDILKMYSDLRNEVEVLVISKHDLEIELVALKNLLEHGDPSLVKLPQETGRELTLQDLEDLDELKTSIEQLKSEMKEKDDYVRKLEEHLLGAERGLPSLTSTPKPQTSKGEPAMSKAYRQRKLLQIGKRAFSHDLPIVSVPEETNEEPTVSKQDDDSGQDTPLNESDLNQSNVSEKLFTQRLAMKDSAFTSSQQSDQQSLASSCSSLDSSKIRSGLKPEEDGHLALELKQFELVDEISNLKRDFRETKALYAQETALLSEALEKEKAYKEYLESGRGRTVSDPSGKQNFVVDFPKDVVRLRQDVAVLKEENKLLKLENERWIRKIKEQEKIVFDLKDRLLRNTSGIEEIEEVFGRQLALLQKQREELFDKLKAREDDNHKLSAIIGEKGVLEESLRREKDILISKLNEKTDVENELKEKQETLVVLQTKHKEMEDIIYQKDLNERELMKQKRLLEEELHEIESKFKDREENLGYEKNQLLDELRVKKDSKPSVSESDLDDTRSVCSDGSSYSDRHIASLELTLVDVEKQHAEAVRVLREQLKSKYSRRERALRRDHRENLEKLHNSAKEQVT